MKYLCLLLVVTFCACEHEFQYPDQTFSRGYLPLSIYQNLAVADYIIAPGGFLDTTGISVIYTIYNDEPLPLDSITYRREYADGKALMVRELGFWDNKKWAYAPEWYTIELIFKIMVLPPDGNAYLQYMFKYTAADYIFR